MTLDSILPNKLVRVLRIIGGNKETITALQEVGLFKGQILCKLCQNKAKCSIYKINGCNRIMLHANFSRLVEVEELTEDYQTT